MAAKAHIENLLSENPLPTGQVLENIGYSKGVSLTPSMVTESAGFKQSLAEFGLTEQFITNALVEDIKAKPAQRHQELKLGADILGMVKREEKPVSDVKNTYNFIFSPEVQARVNMVNEDIKRILTIPPDVQKDT